MTFHCSQFSWFVCALLSIGKSNARQKRLMLNRKEKYMQIHGSGETLLDGTLREVSNACMVLG
jgi:hypothetical protein